MILMKEYLDTYKKNLTAAIWAIEEPEVCQGGGNFEAGMVP